MNSLFCPNLQTCKFINSEISESFTQEKDFYLSLFCRSECSNWQDCKRYQTKSILGFCPDFVLPDSTMAVDQIIEKFDKENITN